MARQGKKEKVAPLIKRILQEEKMPLIRFSKGLGALKQKSEHIAQEPKKKVPPEPCPEPEGNDYFTEAMSGVTPLSENNRIIAKAPDMETRPAHPPNISDLETLAHLSDLVSGTAEMDITFSDEYIEGSVKGFDRKLMQRLKDGLFPVQDYVDLHGLKNRRLSP